MNCHKKDKNVIKAFFLFFVLMKSVPFSIGILFLITVSSLLWNRHLQIAKLKAQAVEAEKSWLTPPAAGPCHRCHPHLVFEFIHDEP